MRTFESRSQNTPRSKTYFNRFLSFSLIVSSRIWARVIGAFKPTTERPFSSEGTLGEFGTSILNSDPVRTEESCTSALTDVEWGLDVPDASLEEGRMVFETKVSDLVQRRVDQ